MAAALIIIAGSLAYSNSFHGPFIFDDSRSIENNPTIRGLWPITTVLDPKRQTSVAGRPMANLSFAINYAFGGLKVEGYHVVNVAVHILAALTVFGVLRRVLRASAAPVLDEATADGLALASALIWVVHPLNTEAVDYLTQRTEAMAGLFSLLTLYGAIRAWHSERPGRWQTLAALACACGVATKESVVTVPILVLLYDRLFVCHSFKTAFERRGRLYMALAATWLIFAGLVSQAPFLSGAGFATRVTPWTYLINQAPIIVTYLRLSVWPRRLVLDYGVAAALSVADVWPSALCVVALLALTIVALVRRPAFGFWGLWFFITLAPASSVLPIPTEVGAERRMYLPLVAVVVVLVLAGYLCLQRLDTRAQTTAGRRGLAMSSRLVAAALIVVVLIGLTATTLQRNDEYRSGVSIWQTVLARHPHPRAHMNLATELLDAGGRSDEAVAHLRTAAADLPEAKRLLGVVLLSRGDARAAVAQLSDFVRLKPNDPEILIAREELAAALVAAGDLDGAKAQLLAVASAAPLDPTGRLKLGDVLLSSEDFEGAVAQYRECLRLQPNNVAALTHLGNALASTGRPNEAIQSLRDALRWYPASSDARRDLVGILLAQRRFLEAENESRALVASHAEDAAAHNTLGIALASQGRLDDAAQEFRVAVRLDGGFVEARNNLVRAIELLARGQKPKR